MLAFLGASGPEQPRAVIQGSRSDRSFARQILVNPVLLLRQGLSGKQAWCWRASWGGSPGRIYRIFLTFSHRPPVGFAPPPPNLTRLTWCAHSMPRGLLPQLQNTSGLYSQGKTTCFSSHSTILSGRRVPCSSIIAVSLVRDAGTSKGYH